MILKLADYDKIYEKDFLESKEYKEFEEEYFYLKRIRNKELYNLVVDIINKYSNKEKITNATKICNLLMFMLKDRNLIQKDIQQNYVDLLIAACYLHNIETVTKKKWRNSYVVRDIILKEYKEQYYMLESAIDPICDTIEGQLGQNIPIKGSRPNPNTPGEMFATSVSIINNYK